MARAREFRADEDALMTVTLPPRDEIRLRALGREFFVARENQQFALILGQFQQCTVENRDLLLLLDIGVMGRLISRPKLFLDMQRNLTLSKVIGSSISGNLVHPAAEVAA